MVMLRENEKERETDKNRCQQLVSEFRDYQYSTNDRKKQQQQEYKSILDK